jgi:hypothetical protein
VADGVVRDHNNGAGFLPEFLGGSRSSDPPLDHPYLPARLTPQYAPAAPAVASAPAPAVGEEKPPAAQGAQLSASQVRYCLAQGIRLQGVGKVVNTAISEQSRRFLALAADLDSRCGNYRSAPDVMQSVKEEVEARRAALELEGAALIRTPANTPWSPSPPAGRRQ